MKDWLLPYIKMKTNISIALARDGIGQEISNESKKIFNWLNNKTNKTLRLLKI